MKRYIQGELHVVCMHCHCLNEDLLTIHCFPLVLNNLLDTAFVARKTTAPERKLHKEVMIVTLLAKYYNARKCKNRQ